jgi:hypothetical protein
VIALGCSSASSEPSGPPELRSFCMDYMSATGGHSYACRGGSPDALVAQIQAMDWCNATAVAIGAAHVTFDASAAAACLADIPALACWQTPGASPNCTKVFTGTVAEGGECYGQMGLGAQDCAPGTVCSMSGNDCTGTCVAHVITPRLAVIGGTCTSAGGCGGDDGALTCVDSTGPIQSGTGTCQVPAESGPCNYYYDCRSTCAHATGITPGTCQAAKQLGDPCTPMNGECGVNAYCAAATNTCVAYPAIGQPCGGDFNALNQCRDGICAGSGSGQCVRYGKRGDPCSDIGIDTCGVGNVMCDSTTLRCTPTCSPGNGCGAPGQICCRGQRCNAGSFCSSGVCR